MLFLSLDCEVFWCTNRGLVIGNLIISPGLHTPLIRSFILSPYQVFHTPPHPHLLHHSMMISRTQPLIPHPPHPQRKTNPHLTNNDHESQKPPLHHPLQHIQTSKPSSKSQHHTQSSNPSLYENRTKTHAKISSVRACNHYPFPLIHAGNRSLLPSPLRLFNFVGHALFDTTFFLLSPCVDVFKTHQSTSAAKKDVAT